MGFLALECDGHGTTSGGNRSGIVPFQVASSLLGCEPIRSRFIDR